MNILKRLRNLSIGALILSTLGWAVLYVFLRGPQTELILFLFTGVKIIFAVSAAGWHITWWACCKKAERKIARAKKNAEKRQREEEELLRRMMR